MGASCEVRSVNYGLSLRPCDVMWSVSIVQCCVYYAVFSYQAVCPVTAVGCA